MVLMKTQQQPLHYTVYELRVQMNVLHLLLFLFGLIIIKYRVVFQECDSIHNLHANTCKTETFNWSTWSFITLKSSLAHHQ